MAATEGEVPGLAVRGRPLLPLNPPLSLRLSKPLLGSDLGVARLARGVPEVLRRSSKSPAGDKAGDTALEGTCHQQQTCCSLCSLLCTQMCKILLSKSVVFFCKTQLQTRKRQKRKSNVNLKGSADMYTMCRRSLLDTVDVLAWKLPDKTIGCLLTPTVCPVIDTTPGNSGHGLLTE